MWLAVLAISAAAVCVSTTAWACACCTDPGQRLEQTVALDSGLLENVQRVRLAPTARLFADAGFPDSVKGVSNPSDGGYRVRFELVDHALRFDVVAPHGEIGQIILALPRRMSRLEVDPRLTAPAPNHGPALYKEWRIAGTAKLSGIFAGSRRPLQARFVLHGQGNSCTTADDFSSWTLMVTGPDVRFSLLGDVARDARAR